MIKITDPSACTGCSACESICGKGAITMVPDRMGFLYPSVNADLCVECGLCEKICADIKSMTPEYRTRAFAVRHRDMQEVMQSRSGAAFVALSDRILALGGSVYGAAFDSDWSVHHTRAVSKKERDAFRGSKYIQSRMEGSIKAVVGDLQDGKWVLFSGTPCQCRGVKTVVDRKAGLSDKLILVDIVCHGVPSPKVWDEYLKMVAGRMAGKEAASGKANGKSVAKVAAVEFRDKKRYGWKAHKETVTFNDGKTYSSRSFTDLFYKHIILRPSCAQCIDNKPGRVTDLTLADFWGWEKTDPALNADDKGYSLVLVNSEKGRSLLEAVSGEIFCREVKLEDCLQRPLQEPVRLDPRSGELADELERKGIKSVLKKYGDHNFSSRWTYFKKNFRQKIRKLAGRI